MTDPIEFAQPRHRQKDKEWQVPLDQTLDALQAELMNLQQQNDQAIRDSEGNPDKLTRSKMIAGLLLLLPLHEAMKMADEITKIPEYKPPSNKIELAMLLNEWAQTVYNKQS